MKRTDDYIKKWKEVVLGLVLSGLFFVILAIRLDVINVWTKGCGSFSSTRYISPEGVNILDKFSKYYICGLPPIMTGLLAAVFSLMLSTILMFLIKEKFVRMMLLVTVFMVVGWMLIGGKICAPCDYMSYDDSCPELCIWVPKYKVIFFRLFDWKF